MELPDMMPNHYFFIKEQQFPLYTVLFTKIMYKGNCCLKLEYPKKSKLKSCKINKHPKTRHTQSNNNNNIY